MDSVVYSLSCKSLSIAFRYRIKILPMGSYPRIMDTNNSTYDLYVIKAKLANTYYWLLSYAHPWRRSQSIYELSQIHL